MYILVGILFLVLGIIVHKLKWVFLIAGYNTMSKEKKENVDTEGLGRLFGWYSYLNGGFFLLSGLLEMFAIRPPVAILWGFFTVSTVLFVLMAQKYDGNVQGKEGKLRGGQGKMGVALILTLFLAGGFVLGLFYFSSRPTQVTVMSEGFEIQGMYGQFFADASVEQVTLEEVLPKIERRTNGSAFGPHLKGWFQTTELGSVKLFVHRDKPPFIYLKTEEGWTIFNLENESETRTFFDTLKAWRK